MSIVFSKLLGGAAFVAVVASSLYRHRAHRRWIARAGALLRRDAIPRTTLTPHAIAIIRATAPVVSRHSAEIVNKFYEIFFRRHPEMRSLFSLARGGPMDADKDSSARAMAVCPVRKNSAKKNISGMQARAMAHAICTYAAQIGDTDHSAFEEVVNKIANKHVSHHVTPDMYPSLGNCLLEAIFSVLDGVAANADVLAAWTDAYWYLAETLMMAEDRIIEGSLADGRGWVGFRPFTVRKQIESESICSVYLTPDDGVLPLPLFQPGQYVTLRVTLPNGSVTHRNYSLSDAPGKDYFRISVKRVLGGEVSNFIHDVLRSGDKLQLSVPCGTFSMSRYFDAQRSHRIALKDVTARMPLVFMSAGIGNTPFISMLNSIYDPAVVPSVPMINPTTPEITEKCAVLHQTADDAHATCALTASSTMSTDAVLFESAELANSIPILYFHAAKNKRHDAFFAQSAHLNEKHKGCTVITVYSQPRPVVDTPGKDYQAAGHVDEALLRSSVADPKNTVFFICGPDQFTRAQYRNILEIGGSHENIVYERFAPGGFMEQLTSKLSF